MLEIIDSKDTRSLKDKRIDSSKRECCACKYVGTTQWHNFVYMFDLSPDPEYGMINAKLKLPYNNNGNWSVNINMEHNYDTLIILCIDMHMRKVVRAYVIPESDVYGKRNITIVRDPHPSIGSKWEEFRIDEKSCGLYDDAFQSIMSFLGEKKYFGIDDIKKWMEA